MFNMTVQGYFDGTAVRTIEPLDLPVNQKVYITIPTADENEQIEKQLATLHKLNGILSEEESSAFDKAVASRVSLHDRAGL